MTQPKRPRNRRVRMARQRGHTLRRIAREFRLSLTRVVQILDDTGGDPLRDELLAIASPAELERERDRLTDRIGCDLRRLIVVEEEIESRRVDELLGLTG